MKSGIELISEERQRQIEVEGYDIQGDAIYTDESLAKAAACYSLPDYLRQSSDNSFVTVPILWPWQKKYWKPSPENRIRELQKAGALIAAEIDRLQRLTDKPNT